VTLAAGANIVQARPLTEKPEITRIEPGGMQRGTALKIKIAGRNLDNLTNVIIRQFQTFRASGTRRRFDRSLDYVKAAADVPPRAYELSVANPGGESGKVKLEVGLLPHAFESHTDSPGAVLSLPVTYGAP